MNVFILTLGTRGDVQPYVALGMGLKAAGHAVTVCTSCNFESFVTGHGLSYGYMNDDILRLINSDAGRRMMDNTGGLWQWFKLARRLKGQAGPMHLRMLNDSWESARKADPDVIVYHPKAFAAPHFAEELGVRAVLGVAMPLLVPSAAFPSIGFPEWKLGGWYNRQTYTLFRKLMAVSFAGALRQWRAERGLPARPLDLLRTSTGEPIQVLHAYSRHVLPRPDDWPPWAFVTGYWLAGDAGRWESPARVREFLDAGSPPVYVGFGSMGVLDPRGMTRLVVEALRRARVRGVIATGWGGMTTDELPDDVLAVDEAPHGWLLPRTAAVVHHGGAGTTAAALRAGRPSVVCPFIGDQPFWGRRLQALGAGSEPIPRKRMTAGRLAAAIREVTTESTYQRRAEALGEKIRLEDGVAEAIAILQGRFS